MSVHDELGRLAQAKIEAESEAEIARIEAETEARRQRAAADFLWRPAPLESRVQFNGELIQTGGGLMKWLRRRLWKR